MSSFTLFWSIGIVLNCFYLLICYFVKFSTFYLSLSFSVCRSGDSKSLYWSDVSVAYRRFSLGHSADVQSWTISITLVLSWSCLVKFFQPVENSSDAVWTKSPSQPFFWMSRKKRLQVRLVWIQVECYTYVTTRTRGRPRPSGHPFQYSEIEVIYPWAFVFLSWFWKRFAHGQDCFSERFQNTIRNRF